jgi:hypothetical protein
MKVIEQVRLSRRVVWMYSWSSGRSSESLSIIRRLLAYFGVNHLDEELLAGKLPLL